MDAELGYMRFKESGDSQLSRFGLGYKRIRRKGNWHSKLYITDDLADGNTYLGYRLGLTIDTHNGAFTVLNVSRNALSETDSMVIRNVNIISFAILAPLNF